MEEQPIYQTARKLVISPETKLSYSLGWRHPTPDEVRSLLQIANLTGAQAGQLIGVTGRTIRRYIGGEKIIHYAEWRLLLIYAGLVTAETMPLPPSKETSQ